MSTTTVIHVRDMEIGDIYIGRINNRHRLKESIWANNFVIAGGVTRELSLKLYERSIRVMVGSGLPDYDIETLRGKRLACWCAPKPCHGDVLVKILAERKGVRGDG